MSAWRNGGPRSRLVAITFDIGRRAVVLGLLWLLLAGFEPRALAAGILATAGSTGVSLFLLPPPQPRPPLGPALHMVALVMRGMVVGGLDVARRAFLPRRRMAEPGYLLLPLAGTAEPGVLALSYAVSLMPGTVGARLEKDVLELHALDRDRGADAPPGIESAAGLIGEHLEERRATWKR